MEDVADGGIAAEIMSRHSNSRQPESQQVVAVLRAISEVVKGEGLDVTPTAMFAATMSALEQPETIKSPQVTLAACTLLSTILARVPNAVLRAKFNGCVKVISGIVERFKDQAPVAKASLSCLSQVVVAMDPTNFPSALAPFTLLLSFLLDARPKVCSVLR